MRSSALLRLSAAAAAAALGLGLVGPVPTSLAADALPPGVLIAQRWNDGPDYIELDASPGYVAYSYGQTEGADASVIQIRRMSDGSLARTIPRFLTVGDRTITTRLAGATYVQTTDSWYSATNPPRYVEIYDIESGDLLHHFDLATDETVVGNGDSWIMTWRTDGTVHLRRLDGSDTTLTGLLPNATEAATVVASDAQTVLVREYSVLFAVDLATGIGGQVATNVGYDAPVFLTAHRIYWTDPWTSNPRVSWADPDGSNAGTVVLNANVWQFGALGDELVAYTYPQGAKLYRGILAPVDTDHGTLGPAIASRVAALRTTGNGTLAVVLADTPTGRVVRLEPDAAEHPVVDLPGIGWGVSSAHLSGGQVVATWFQSDYGKARPAQIAPSTGGGEWTESADPDTAAALRGNQDAYYAPALAGDVLLTATDAPTLGAPGHYRLSWPGGGRDITAGGVFLGHGGQLLARDTVNGLVVEDVRTGAPRTALPDTWPPVMDGTWVWTGPDAAGVVHGVDTAGAQPSRSIATGCAKGALRDVRGRWALMACAPGDQVIDLAGAEPAWTVPYEQPYPGSAVLGNGFVVWHQFSLNWAPSELVVADLGPAHSMHRYGPGGGWDSQSEVLAVDDGPGADFLYADRASQLRRVDLDWLTTAPDPTDTAAPVLQQLTGSTGNYAALTGGNSASFGWSYADATDQWVAPTGVASYDVRYGTAAHGTTPTWVYPPQWQATTATALSVAATAGTDTCFAVRARDLAGNVSDWSTSRCSTIDPFPPVDHGPPVMTTATVGPRIPATIDPLGVVITFAAHDDLGVTSYDTQWRVAAGSGGFGPWTVPVSDPATTTNVRVLLLGGSDGCFRVRAHDAAGNVSAWTPETCTTVSVDDRALKPVGAVKLKKNSLALGKTVTRLSEKGTGVQLKVTAHQVGIWVVQGPGQGSLDVRLDGKLIGHVKGSASTWRRKLIVLPTGTSKRGTLQLIDHSDKPVLVDAVAVARS